MYIRKQAGTWDRLAIIMDADIDANRMVTPAIHTSFIRLNADDIDSLFDQFLELGNVKLDNVTVKIAGKEYTFNSDMAAELFRTVSVVGNDLDGLDATEEHLPENEWTEEYLMSL